MEYREETAAKGDSFKMDVFRYGKLSLVYPKLYYQFVKEQFIYDVYHVNLLKEDNVVLDLGANIGTFTILASKAVGKNGKVIAVEPNPQDYRTLQQNLQRNNCQNVTSINLGVGKNVEEKEISFWGRTFFCKIDTLDTILSYAGIKKKIGFIKMDIEGYEVDVISSNIEIFKDTDVVSIECHATKTEIDRLLLPLGFAFRPLTSGYVYRKMLKSLVYHPRQFFKTSLDTVSRNPSLIYKVIKGYDILKDQKDNVTRGELVTVVGTYTKAR